MICVSWSFGRCRQCVLDHLTCSADIYQSFKMRSAVREWFSDCGAQQVASYEVSKQKTFSGHFLIIKRIMSHIKSNFCFNFTDLVPCWLMLTHFFPLRCPSLFPPKPHPANLTETFLRIEGIFRQPHDLSIRLQPLVNFKSLFVDLTRDSLCQARTPENYRNTNPMFNTICVALPGWSQNAQQFRSRITDEKIELLLTSVEAFESKYHLARWQLQWLQNRFVWQVAPPRYALHVD